MRAVSPSRPSDTKRKPDLPSLALARGSKVSFRALSTDGSNALEGGFGSVASGGIDAQPAARMTPRNAIVHRPRIRRVVYSGRRANERNDASETLSENARLGMA